MSLTNFPNGILSPIYAGVDSPYGKKSKVYFVDPINGLDGNDGLDPNRPVKTLLVAYNKTVSGNNDTIYLFQNGATGGSARLDATLVWAKNAVHLVGVCPPGVNPRARIAETSGADVSPLITLSGDGCQFKNISMFQGYATAEAQNCLAITGQRNSFFNCKISGMGATLAGAQAGSRSLTLSGNGENYFYGCFIGLDTIARSGASAEVEFLSASVRNVFEKCHFETYATSADALFLKAGTGALDRYTKFIDCDFCNGGTSTMDAVAEIHASAGGKMYGIGHTFCDGCADWHATDTELFRLMMPVAVTATSGLGVGVDVTP